MTYGTKTVGRQAPPFDGIRADAADVKSRVGNPKLLSSGQPVPSTCPWTSSL